MTGENQKPRNIRRLFAEAARHGGDFTLYDSGMRITDILAELDRHGDAGVLARYPGILSQRDIDVCRSVAAHHMPQRPEYINNGGTSTVRILFDENMPHRIIPKLLNGDCRLTHISFHGLTTATDDEIWAYAKGKGFKALVTRDTDFLRIIEMEVLERLRLTRDFNAARLDDLPLVVHISSKSQDELLAHPALLKTNMRRVAAIVNTGPRTFGSIVLKVNGHGAAQTPRDIYKRYMKSTIRENPPATPVFDKALMNHDYITRLRARHGMPPLVFSEDPQWAAFSAQTCATLRARKQSGPSAPQA